VLRQWFQSKDFQKQRAAMEIAFGKVPNVTHLSGEDGEHIVIEVRKVEGNPDHD
jgi:hypothetical protein